MRFALPPEFHQHRHEAVAVAIAAIGVGMFIGASIIGPLISHDVPDRAADLSEHTSFEAMVARPDPSPYRTPTPTFDVSNAPNYAAEAKAKARAELGDAPSGDEAWNGTWSGASDREQEENNRSFRGRGHYRRPDRFAPL